VHVVVPIGMGAQPPLMEGAELKVVCLLAALCVSEAAWAQGPRATVWSNRAATRTVAPGSDSSGTAGCWWRTPDGRWLWVTGTRILPNGQTALRTYSYYRPQTTIRDESNHPQIIGGIDWYLNGRGPFSD
jgi:hypothetical protein